MAGHANQLAHTVQSQISDMSASTDGGSHFNCRAIGGCSCSEEIFSCECAAVGAGLIVWSGSSVSDSGCQNIVLYRDYVPQECGGIRAQHISVTDTEVVSQLNITVDFHHTGKTLQCVLNNGPGSQTLIGSTTLDFTSGMCIQDCMVYRQ